MVELFDQEALLVDFLADFLSLELESSGDFVDFIQMLILFLDEMVLHATHFNGVAVLL